MAKIVLCSGSPRRQELLRRIGIEQFDIRVPQVEETYPAGLNPRETVEYISREKAEAARRLCAEDEIFITADTMVFLDDARLGKPHDEADALRMLTALQGRRHTVCTGVSVGLGNHLETESEATEVVFRPATEAELRGYIRTGEPGQGGRLRRPGQGCAAGRGPSRRFLQRHGPAGAAAVPDAGAVRRIFF